MLPAHPRLPVWLKLAYTGFLAVLAPIYWREYGPTNYLYFCDVALVLGLGAVWLEHPLLASTALVGILVPQTFWVIDFFAELLGLHLTGLAAYMFDERKPLFLRLLSFFHFWLPFFLLSLVWRLGYDRRALVAWTLLGWVLMGVCYVAMPPPPPPPDNPNMPVNINYVYGLGREQPQQWLPPDWYFAALMAFMPLCVYWPTHRLLAWLFDRPRPSAAWAQAT